MEQSTRTLPLRLIPTKGGQIIKIVLGLAFIGVAGIVLQWMDPRQIITASGNFTTLFIAVMTILPFFVIPLAVIGGSALKLLPGSPCYYLQIGPDALVHRQGFRIRRFAWSELSRFAVYVDKQTTHSRGGSESTSKYYYVVAVRPQDEEFLQDSSQRNTYAIFKISADEYGGGDGAEDANALADWLTEIRQQALTNRGRVLAVLGIPPEFRDTASAPGAAASSVVPGGPSSVIER